MAFMTLSIKYRIKKSAVHPQFLKVSLYNIFACYVFMQRCIHDISKYSCRLRYSVIKNKTVLQVTTKQSSCEENGENIKLIS